MYGKKTLTDAVCNEAAGYAAETRACINNGDEVGGEVIRDAL